MKNTKHGTTNYRALQPYLQAADNNGGYAKFTSGGYMDLVVERLFYSDYEGNPVYSICHYGEQNGDLMRDPEITFSTDGERIQPLSFQNDYMGFYEEVFIQKDGKTLYSPRRLAGNDDFLWKWLKNLEAQGFSPERFKQAV